MYLHERRKQAHVNAHILTHIHTSTHQSIHFEPSNFDFNGKGIAVVVVVYAALI